MRRDMKTNALLKDLRKRKKFVNFVLAPLALTVLLLSYIKYDVSLSVAISLTAIVSTLSTCAFDIYQRKVELKQSGLSEAEYMVAEAGGSRTLFGQAVTVRAIGWLCIIVPVLLLAFVMLGTRSLSVLIVIASVLGLICIPCAWGCFRLARKMQRAAEDAGSKIR